MTINSNKKKPEEWTMTLTSDFMLSEIYCTFMYESMLHMNIIPRNVVYVYTSAKTNAIVCRDYVFFEGGICERKIPLHIA